VKCDSNDSDVDEPKPKKTTLADLFGSEVLMTGVSEATRQSLTSQIDHDIARYRKEISISLNGCATCWCRKKSSQYPLLGKQSNVISPSLGFQFHPRGFSQQQAM